MGMKRNEALDTLYTALKKLYDLFYKEDGTGVSSGLQTYLKEYDIPYANYVCKALKENGVVKSMGKREPLTYYNLPHMITEESVRRIYDEALVAAGRSQERIEHKSVTMDVEQSKEPAAIIARIHRKSDVLKKSILEAEDLIKHNDEEIERMQEQIKHLSQLNISHQENRERYLYTQLIYQDLLS